VVRGMTGYGSSERTDGGQRIRVELKSVNQRFLDIQIKAPRVLLKIEDKLRQAIESRLARGRVTVYVEWRNQGEAAATTLNPGAAAKLVKELRGLKDALYLPGDVDLATLSRFPQLFESDGETPEAEAVWAAFEPVLAIALDELVAMREAEGGKLNDDLSGRLGTIADIVADIEAAVPEATAALRQRQTEKIRALLDETVPVDETRLAQELAIAAERSDFTEEIVRLRAHLSHANETLSSGEPVGKRLNFLVQEMHREANTIGSKTADVGVSSTVVNLKEEIEKVREQIQNVE